MTLHMLEHRVRRPLPRTVRPMPGETVNSYLHRLANANHITEDDLATHLGARQSKLTTKVPLQALAVASGQPAATLARALPELGPDPPVASRATPAPDAPAMRWACRRCTATRGVTTGVVVWTVPEHNLCLRHQLWTGQAVTWSTDQIDLADHPEVVHAQLRHYRLTRRFGPGPARAAFQWATELWLDVTLRGWGEPYHIPRNLHPDANGRRRDRQAGSGHPWVPYTHDPVYQAATYPEAVTLTGLVAHPHWRALAISDSEGDHDWFHAELWRRLPNHAAAERPRLRNLRNLLRHAASAPSQADDRRDRQP
jgi:hypothetical protein